MKLITKDTDYAIRVLLQLALKKDKYLSSKEIAAKQKTPYEYTRKVISVLAKHDLVATKEGNKGGVRLAHDPKKISVTNIIEVFQGKVELIECMFNGKICSNRPGCVLRKNISKIEIEVEEKFNKLTLRSLLDEMGV